MIYYTETVSFSNTAGNFYGLAYGPTDCVNLRTGELIWSRTDVPALSFGLVFDVQDNNQHGVYLPILFTSSWRAFDADTGNPLFNVTGVPSGTKAMGPNGEYLIYVIANAGNATNPDYRLAEWNSTKLWSGDGFTGPGYANGGTLIPTISGTVDGSTSSSYDWNVSLPSLNTMTSTPTAIAAYCGDIMLCHNGSLPAGYAALTFAAPLPGALSASGAKPTRRP